MLFAGILLPAISIHSVIADMKQAVGFLPPGSRDIRIDGFQNMQRQGRLAAKQTPEKAGFAVGNDIRPKGYIAIIGIDKGSPLKRQHTLCIGAQHAFGKEMDRISPF